MRCDGEPVRLGMRTTRRMSRASQPDKQNGTLSVHTIKASGLYRPHQQAEHKTAPDHHAKASNQPLQCGSHPHRTQVGHRAMSETQADIRWPRNVRDTALCSRGAAERNRSSRRQTEGDSQMHLWLIPMVYAAASFLGGITLPRLEQAYFPYNSGISVASAQAFFTAVASGMIALTGIVFTVGLVLVQFSAIAYSPRLVLLLARDPRLFHSLGVFIATFTYSLSVLLYVDRNGSGVVPLISGVVVAGLLLLSMLLFSALMKGLMDLQITYVLHVIGDKGREVVREMFQRLDEKTKNQSKRGPETRNVSELGPVVQTLKYFAAPRTIAKFDIDDLVRQAQQAEAVIVMACGVGDTLVENTLLLQVHGAKTALPESDLVRAIHFGFERTSEQDPKYPIRLLVDIAIKALSPAINDPTTAVQAIDQIEDLLRRLGGHDLDAGYGCDADGVLRLIFPMPTWEDYLVLAFDEIRHYGADSVQVVRRLRSALVGLANSVTDDTRIGAVQRYLKQLDLTVDHSILTADDQETAGQEDRQGLGLPRRQRTSP